MFWRAHEATWSPGHAARWWSQIERHILVRIGSKHVGDVSSVALLELIGPLWNGQHETAKRLLQRIGAVYEHITAAGLYGGQNPTTGLRRALPKVRARVEHFDAMPWAEVPRFFSRLGEGGSVTALAMQFLILTACRSGEVRGARWDEVDQDAMTWTMPAARMKARRDHIVPLSTPALSLLKRTEGLSPELLFPSPHRLGSKDETEKPLSSVAFDRLLGRMKVESATPHGFRTSFRTWCGDHGVDREVAELCLAHRIGNEVEQAYARSDLLHRRRIVMDQWARHVTGSDAGKIVELRG